MSRIVRIAAFLLLAGLMAAAQIHGTPASVTSLGPNGEIRGTPASVTSLGPFGWQPPPFRVPPGFHPRLGWPYGYNRFGYGYGYGAILPYYAPAYPLIYPYGADVGDYGAAYDPYPGDPSTAIDPRAYAMPAAAARTTTPAPAAQPASAPASQPAADQEPTVLVFSDGHRLEVRNYVIVGNNLYDFANGRRRTISLSDLDLPATYRANEERGNDFHLPAARGG